MPTDTFMKLSDEKKQKIIKAAKKEFSRVPFKETSIKKIVQEAEISRGSFYQYFISKEDLLRYLLQDHMEKIKEHLENSIRETQGDIIQSFISMYDYILKEEFKPIDLNFHKQIFENIKTSEDTIFSMEFCAKEKDIITEKIYTQIDKEKLKIQKEEDLKTIISMLSLITRKALVSNFRYNSRSQAREEFIKQMEYLKFGVYKFKNN